MLTVRWKVKRKVVSESLQPHGILQVRILEWVAIPFSRGSSQPRDQSQDSHIAGRFFNQLSHKESPKILEWVAYHFSSGSSQPGSQTRISCIVGGFFTNWAIREAMIVLNVYFSEICLPMFEFELNFFL